MYLFRANHKPLARQFLSMRLFFTGPLMLTLVCSLKHAQTEVGPEHIQHILPDHLYCYGSVMDSDGKPVTGAKIVLANLKSKYWAHIGSPFHKDPVPTKSAEISDNQFEFNLDLDIRQFYAEPMYLVVSARGYATTAVAYPSSRLLTDLPFDIRLNKVASDRLQILDPQGKPLPGAKVLVGFVQNIWLQTNESTHNDHVAISDPEGYVSFAGFDKTNLSGVLIESEPYGCQRILLDVSPDNWQARLAPIGKVRGRFTSSDVDDLSILEGSTVQVSSESTAPGHSVEQARVSYRSAVVDREGRFEIDRVGHGKLIFDLVDSKIPFSGGGISWFWQWTLTEDQPVLEVELKGSKLEQRKVLVQFLDSETGEAIEGIPHQNQLSDSNGMIEVKVSGDASGTQQLRPTDPFSEFVFSNAGYRIDVEPSKDPNQQKVSKVRLVRGRILRGTVIDKNGKPVSGALVSGEYSSPYGNQTMGAVSDKSGKFAIRRLPPKEPITVTAKLGVSTTDSDHTIQVAPDESVELTLRLIPQPTVKLAGQILDTNAKPISGAAVTIHRASLGEEEAYDEADYYPESSSILVQTDSEGRFETEPIIGVHSRFQVTVEASGFRPFESHFLNPNASNRPNDSSRRDDSSSADSKTASNISLGSFQLVPIPKEIRVSLQTRSATNQQPLRDVKLAFVGVNAGHRTAATDSTGKLFLSLPNASQMIAAQAKGYQVLFLPVKELQPTMTLDLIPLTDEYANQAIADRQQHRPAFEQLFQKLYPLIEASASQGDTFFRQSTLRQAQAILYFERFRKEVIAAPGKLPHREDFIARNMLTIFRSDSRLAIDLVNKSTEQPARKALDLGTFAGETDDPELKQELLAESMLLLEQDTTEFRERWIDSIAIHLLMAGERDAAIDLVRRVWDSATRLKEQLKNRKVTVSNFPSLILLLAWLDEDLALKSLESVHQREHETMAATVRMIWYLALIDLERAKKLSTRHDSLTWAYAEDSIRFHLQQIDIDYPHWRTWLPQFAELLNQESVRAELFLFAAVLHPHGAERSGLIDQAIAELMKTGEPLDKSWLPHFGKLTRHEMDRVLFAMLCGPNGLFDEYHDLEGLATKCCWLNLIDNKLATHLLEPAFDGSLWTKKYNRFVWSYNDLVKSTVSIDPALCERLVEGWKEQYGRDDPAIVMQLVGSMIEEFDRVFPPNE